MTRASSLRGERLVARTRRLHDDVDILAHLVSGDFAWWHRGQGLVSAGVACRVPAEDVRDVLSGIDTRGDPGPPGCGPVAVGALPFDRDGAARAELVVPARAWRCDGHGNTWVTDISGSDVAGALLPSTPQVHSAPGVGRVMDKVQWTRAVQAALARIEAGELDKVVLSRQATVERARELSVGDVARRLREDQPGCYVFAAGDFVGASPESLVERRGTKVRSRPMAGTVVRSDDQAMTWLARSEKNRWEHALVVEAVVRGIQELCAEPVYVSQPHAEPFADLAHIVTEVAGRLRPDAPSALDLALRIHPTPAVAGTPTDRALALIDELEPQSRGCYGGPVGWVDANGDGEFAVALRCAELRADQAVLYAGAGIVAGSTCDDEWQETDTKLEAMRRALSPR